MTTPSSTLRFLLGVGRLEGVSFLTLMGVGMPLKYAMDMPDPNAWIGWIHGLLFLMFLVALGSARRTEGWSRMELVWGFVASVLPFGTFVFEARVKRRLRAQ